MKKRLVAIVLSAAMCMTTVLETGAASVFTSPEDAEAAVQEALVEGELYAEDSYEEDSYEEDSYGEGQDVQEEPADIFTSGEPEDALDVITEEVPDILDGADVFTAEAEDETGIVPTAGSIVVSAEDWEAAGEKFRLRKTASAAAYTEAPAAELTDSTFDTEETADGEAEPEELIADEAEAKLQEEEIPEPEEGAAEAAAVSDYYTEADGLLLISTIYKDVTHTGYYLFDAEGYLVTGKKTVKAGTNSETSDTEYYFMDKTNATVYQEFEGEPINPCSSDLGQQLRGKWAWTGSNFCYYDENGRFMTVDAYESIQKKNGTYTGYHEAYKGEYFCLDSKGTPKKGNITLTVSGVSAKYYFDPQPDKRGIPGKMFHNGWRILESAKGQRWLYYNKGVANPADVGKLLERGTIATRLDGNVDPDIDSNKTYLIDDYGYILKSKMAKAQNGAYYCTDAKGVIYKEKLVRYNNVRYYFGADGKRAPWKNMWHKCPGAGNRYYYFGSTAGKVVEKTGWQRVTTEAGKFYGWFYFNKSGNHYKGVVTSAGYYFLDSGRLAIGVHEIDGKKYLFEASDENTHRGKMYKNTLVYYKNKWYYAAADGALRKSGWQSVKGNWYYFDNYRAVTKKFMKRNGVNGYLDSTGKFTTGWVIVSNAQNRVRYIDPDGNGYLKNGSKWVDGLLYYFDANGYRINDLTNIYGGPYYVKVDRNNGVMTVYNSAKTVPVKTIRVSVGNSWTATPLGEYTLYRSARWQPLMGPSWGQYGTHVSGAGQGGIFVHSVACVSANSYNLPAGEYNKLGSPASHGCIRACVADAKWVYDHCNGARILIFDGTYNSNEAMKGPLGRRALVPLKPPYNFDPTDPAV